eukprot:TRINITY_DN4290_c0_g1_i6.p1 TRINITY_DN4290_c0_g1~~TRINITY_DN4290_c0_g1_i6.p1  ORF type:complete len:1545 (-),score=-9.18 TRINITY_DN4290_c0_g1_i6:341-4975(-)
MMNPPNDHLAGLNALRSEDRRRAARREVALNKKHFKRWDGAIRFGCNKGESIACLWLRRPLLKREVYDRLNQTTTQWIRRKVVLQKNGAQRLDVVMPSKRKAKALVHAVNKVGRTGRKRITRESLFTYAKIHVPYNNRDRSQVKQANNANARGAQPPRVQAPSHTLIQWNVNRCVSHDKRARLSHALSLIRPSIVALQETHIREKHHELALRGYNVYQTICLDNASGKLIYPEGTGVAIGVKGNLVSKQYDIYPPETPDNDRYHGLIVVEVKLEDQTRSILIASLYAVRQTKRREVMINALELLAKQGRPTIVMGDFNRRLHGVGNMGYLLGRAAMHAWSLVEVTGSPMTFHRNASARNWSALDHAICCNGAQEAVVNAKVIRRDGNSVSDHFPLQLRLDSSLMTIPKPRATERERHWSINFNSKDCVRQLTQFAHDNRFDELQMRGLDINEATDKWTNIVRQVGDDMHLRVPTRTYKHRGHHLTSKSKRLAKAVSTLFHSFQNNPDDDDARQAFHEASNKLKESSRADIAKQRAKQTESIIESTKDPKVMWRKISRLVEGDRFENPTQPVRNPETGKLALTEGDVGEAWAKHFEKLFEDTSGNSSDSTSTHWNDLRGREISDELTELNEDLKWEEVHEMIFMLKSGKAPGNDNIVSEVLRAATYYDDNDKAPSVEAGEEPESGPIETPYSLFTDGGARGNPGPGGCGAEIRNMLGVDHSQHTNETKGTHLSSTCKYLGHCTNNQAEFAGLVLGLQQAKAKDIKRLHVVMDSDLCVKAMQGRQRIAPTSRLYPFWRKAVDEAAAIPSIVFSHVRRERNTHADALANQAMDAGTNRGFQPRLDLFYYSAERLLEIDLQRLEQENDAMQGGLADPPNAFGRALFRLLKEVWRTGNIPLNWHKAWIACIHKKGSKESCDNYRGISLLNTTYKLLLMILNARIYNTLEKRGFYIRAQGGFRSKEEAVIQSITLLETLQRRMRTKEVEPTYAVFMDLKKAYDMVPRAALFLKLEQAGVQGKMLQFIRNMYDGAEVAAGKHGRYFKPGRGVLQGCPLSPLLFNVFINDIFDGWQDVGKGVKVQTGSPTQHTTIPGMLFADDLVGLCPDLGTFKELIEHLNAWSRANEMPISVDNKGSKTAFMVFHPDATVQTRLKHELRVAGLTAGQDNTKVPIVDKYRYLGSWFQERLDLQHIFNARNHEATKAMYAMQRTLRKTWAPTRIRRILARMKVYPSWFGMELWGMSNTRVEHANIRVQTMVGWVTQREEGVDPFPSTLAIQRELNLPSVHRVASVARSRAFIKMHEVKTYALDLVNSSGPNGTWVQQTKAWLKRPKDLWATIADPNIDNYTKKQAARRRVGAYAQRTYELPFITRDKGLARYNAHRFSATSSWNLEYWRDSEGTRALQDLRTGAYGFKCRYKDPVLCRDPLSNDWDCSACGASGVERTFQEGLIHLFECPQPRRAEARKELEQGIKSLRDNETASITLKEWCSRYIQTSDKDTKIGMLLGSSLTAGRASHREWCQQGKAHESVSSKVVNYLQVVMTGGANSH